MRRLLLSLAVVAAAPFAAAAQSAPSMPDRPRLPKGADANDWEAYYDYAAARLQRDPSSADAALRWAARLDPTRAEPLYGLWVAYWFRNPERFASYLADDPTVLRMAEVQRIDSLRTRAILRNPFVHQGMLLALYERLPGRFREDLFLTAWSAYARGQLPQAVDHFTRLIERDSAKNGHLHFLVASALVNQGKFDSALVHTQAMLAMLRAADERQLGRGYESKELLEYAVALLHAQRGRVAAAREALGRASAENLGFAPAHAMLGQLALARRDTAQALQELGLAVELQGDDALPQLALGDALLQAGRAADAVPHYEAARAAEPYYAEVYAHLGAALEAAGRRTEAMTAFTEFVRRAPKTSPTLPRVQQRLQALSAGAG